MVLATHYSRRPAWGVMASLVCLLCGSLLITPVRADDLKTLWQVGQADGRNNEFAFAPGNYAKFSQDSFFAVGRSDSRQSWSYVQPGPSDSWAGSRSHQSKIVFGLKEVPTAPSTLKLNLLDTQRPLPPKIRVTVNDYSKEFQTPPGGGDDSVSGRLGTNKPYEVDMAVPATALHKGDNLVTITSIAGSWLLYDSVSFEAPAGTETAEVNPIQVSAVEAKPVLLRDKATGALRSPITAAVYNFGPATTATLRMKGETENVPLPTGNNEVSFLTPEVKTETKTDLAIEVGGQKIGDTSVTLRPVRHWTIYLLPHSHVDIGYTQPQEQVRLKQISNLHEALALIKKTASYPADAQFKWNLEVLWPMEDYLRGATPEQRQEFFEAVRSGKLIVNAYYGNLLSGDCSPEELIRATQPSLRVAKQAGVTLDTTLQSDVPGYTWGNVTAMAQAGVKYFSMGPNSSDRIGRTLIEWHDKPFYWSSPSGKSKVLCWMSHGGYSLGHELGKQLIPFLPGYLNGLEDAKYPYDITCLRWCVNGDNGAPDDALSDTVRDWNAQYAYPHLVIAGSREPFVALEKSYAGKIPTYRGDFTPYWEDGVASTARETALRRNATDRLSQAQTIWAMQGRTDFPADQFYKTWEDALLYSEHTWGAYNSISEPDAPFVKTQWEYKQAFALRADATSKQLLAEAGGNSAQIDIFNTESWKRTDLAIIPADQSKTGDRVADAAGHILPSQRLSDGTLAVLVRDIEPFSSRRLSILPGKASPMGSAVAQGNTLSNGTLTVQVDPKSGAISDLRMKGLTGNLIDAKSGTAGNDYYYLLGGDLKNLTRSGPATITVEDAGPLVATLRVESQAAGTKGLTRRIRLVSGIARVDLANTVDKTAVREKEGVHFGFGFNVPGAVTRMDMPLSVVRPEIDQLKGANRNWFPVQHWVDVSNAKYGITWATVDAPLVEIGGVTANLPDFVGQTDPRWIQHTASSPTLYSWPMNNHWHTNYKADQEGPVTFRYAIAPHGAFAADAAARTGLEVSRPLVALPAAGVPKTGSLLQVSSPSVIVAELKPSDDGQAWIVRLWGASGRDQNVRLKWQGHEVKEAYLSDTAEEPKTKLGSSIAVPGYELVTIRIPRGK